MPQSLVSLLSIPEYRRSILAYVWFNDLREITITCKDVRHYVIGDINLVTQLWKTLTYHCHNNPKANSLLPEKMSFFEVMQLSSRICSWPIKAMVGLPLNELRRRQRYALKEVSVDGRSCILFDGDRGRDRAFFSDDHFPVTGHFGNLSREDAEVLSPALLPFTKPYIFPMNSPEHHQSTSVSYRCSNVLSCISYFEITVMPAMLPTNPRSRHPSLEEFLPPPCVCIGMARPGFSAFSMQPGWDANSFALHCDDGSLYFGDGSNSIDLETTTDTHFGVHDTVGIGLIHGRSKGALFFTKNGKVIGIYMPSEMDAQELVRYPWFGAVGVDCYCPIACNFGSGNDSRPFAFDVHGFENDLKLASAPELMTSKLDFLTEKYALPTPRSLLVLAVTLVEDVWKDFTLPVEEKLRIRGESSLSARQWKLAQSLKQRRVLPWFHDLQHS
jgi:hypothetical protein